MSHRGVEESWAIRCVCLARAKAYYGHDNLDLTPRLARGSRRRLVMRVRRFAVWAALALQYAQCSFSAHRLRVLVDVGCVKRRACLADGASAALAVGACGRGEARARHVSSEVRAGTNLMAGYGLMRSRSQCSGETPPHPHVAGLLAGARLETASAHLKSHSAKTPFVAARDRESESSWRSQSVAHGHAVHGCT